MAGEDQKSFEATDFGWLVAMSLVFFALVLAGLWLELRTEWTPYQRRFRELLGHYGKVDEARSFRSGIRQIWIPEIGVVDRCITCHLGYEWASVLPATVPQPLTPHPPLAYLEKHEFAEFGCTPCHGGQGWATNAAAAHEGGRGWDDPMLSSALARRYGLTMGQMIQMRCNFCHRHDIETQAMDEINLGKRLFKQRKCIVCHVVEGRGGVSGPELTYHGDRNPELFDFSHVERPKTLFNWDVQHLIAAGQVTPGTQMPDYNFPPEQARALTLLMLSWRRVSYPPQYIPAPVAAASPLSAPTPASNPPPAPAH